MGRGKAQRFPVEEIARRAFRNRGFLKSEAMFELLPPPQDDTPEFERIAKALEVSIDDLLKE